MRKWHKLLKNGHEIGETRQFIMEYSTKSEINQLEQIFDKFI